MVLLYFYSGHISMTEHVHMYLIKVCVNYFLTIMYFQTATLCGTVGCCVDKMND